MIKNTHNQANKIFSLAWLGLWSKKIEKPNEVNHLFSKLIIILETE